MRRIVKIDLNIPCCDIQNKSSNETYVISKQFDNGEEVKEEYCAIEEFVIKKGKNVVSNCLIQKKLLQNKIVDQNLSLEFNNCVFTNEINLNFRDFKGDVVFKNCIFNCHVTLLGYFYGYVSFEGSSFINAAINFQECLFDSFNFELVTLSECDVCFQQTEFRDEKILFSNTHLHGSRLLFINTIFPTSGKLLDFSSIEADCGSFIIFHLVDFDFREFRLFSAKINTLIFAECTFSCNRFEWDFECETIILQGSSNFRIMNLLRLKGLKNLNINGFSNTGIVTLNNDVNYYLDALRTSKAIFWIRADEYRTITLAELKNQLFTLSDFFTQSQSRQKEIALHEINIIEREEQMMLEQGLKMKIFLSYSWKDEALVDSIDTKFSDAGITLIRDKRGIEYRDSIKEFMKQIRFIDFVVLVISPDYLKSANCMYEITELTKDENYKSRILPIVKKGTRIYEPHDRSLYVLYWQEEYKRLYADSNKLEPLNRSAIISELMRYERIKRDLPSFLENISDMKLIECDDSIGTEDFSKMISIVSGNI